jgi:hypothetical protein
MHEFISLAKWLQQSTIYCITWFYIFKKKTCAVDVMLVKSDCLYSMHFIQSSVYDSSMLSFFAYLISIWTSFGGASSYILPKSPTLLLGLDGITAVPTIAPPLH